MSRILAIDYGTKRTGLAITDPLQIIASALDTIATETLFEYLDKLFTAENIQTVIVGQPKQLDGSATHSTAIIEEFVVKLQNKYPSINIYRIDERFTSKIAFNTMINSGLKKNKRKDKAIVDQIAATIMLQDWLYNQ